MVAAVDQFKGGNKSQIDAPYTVAETVTPSDTVEFTNVSRAIYVGVAGNITALMANGTAQLFKNVPVGLFKIRARRINATATAATDMVALS